MGAQQQPAGGKPEHSTSLAAEPSNRWTKERAEMEACQARARLETAGTRVVRENYLCTRSSRTRCYLKLSTVASSEEPRPYITYRHRGYRFSHQAFIFSFQHSHHITFRKFHANLRLITRDALDHQPAKMLELWL